MTDPDNTTITVCAHDRCWALTPTIYPTCPQHDEGEQNDDE